LREPALDFTRTAFGATLLFALFTLSACASASAPASFDPLPLGRSVIAPTGFVQFCQRRPDQCVAVEPVAEHSPIREPSTPDLSDRPPTLSLVVQPGTTADADVFTLPPSADAAWPDADVTRLDYRPTAMISRRDPEVDIDSWTPIEIAASSPSDDKGPLKAYTVISRDASGARLRLSPQLEAEIARVDVSINRAITPRTDLEAFGVDNYWTLPLTDGPKPEGNCKHYALEKRRQLVSDGVPADALSLAIVTTPANEVHAVLVVSTDQGDLVLDNLTDAIRPWRQTDYHWLVRQTPGAPMHWVEVG
jgi:predicted transglutaminase-like cysteine proteinase